MLQTSLIAFVAFTAGGLIAAWLQDRNYRPERKKGDRGFVESIKSTVTPENKAEYIRNVAIAGAAASMLFSAIILVGSILVVVQTKAIKQELQTCLTGQVLEEPALTTADYEDEDDE